MTDETTTSDEDGEGRLVVELQGVDKRHLALVWEKMKKGEVLEGAEHYIGRSLADHPEYFPMFEAIGLLEGDDTLPDGTNPFAHVSFHVMIGSQVFNQSPPEAEVFYRRRLRMGDDRHDVVHMMINVFQRHLMWAADHASGPGDINLDLEAYGKTLKTLWKLKTKRLWARLGQAD